MVTERQNLGIGAYLKSPDLIQKKNFPIQTRGGYQMFSIEDIPNNFGGRRHTMISPLLTGNGIREHIVDLNTVRGFIAEGWTRDMLSDLFPELIVVPATAEMECSVKKEQKGGDILILQQEGIAYTTLLVIDATTRCSSGLGKKRRAGINPTLMAPVVSLPLGDLFISQQADGTVVRAKEHFDSKVLPAILNDTYDPFIGIDDPEAFSTVLLKSLLNVVSTSSTHLFIDLQKIQVYAIKPYEMAVKKLGKMRTIIESQLIC